VRAGLRPRQFKNTMRSIVGPVLLIHGDRDRLVPIAAARNAAAANPQWDTEFLHDVGHTPQLEAPDAVISAVERWLDRHELGATAANKMTAPTEEN
jgi:pimeloyl-ACP methyl ester carboxylesterase